MSPTQPVAAHPSVFAGEPLVQLKGGNIAHGHFLVEYWPENRRTVKWRGDEWETWSAPVEVFGVPASSVVTQ